MPLLAAQPVNQRLTIGIYRVVGQNDEAVTSPTYATGLRTALEQIYKSAFWMSKARFAQARQRLNETAFLAHGWDTYGAESPNDLARTLADKILNVLETASLPPTRLTPSVEGGIAMSFVEGSNRAVIEIYNTGAIAAATYSDEGEPAVWELDSETDALQGTIAQIRVHLAT